MHTNINRHNTGYDVVLANTEESKNTHFNLRYQIYCLEKGYEEASKFTDGLEKDDYDEQAVHFLIRHKADNQWVGTFRLIIHNFDELPICRHAHIEHAYRVNSHKPVAEFSRLAIIRPFQKLPGKSDRDVADADCCIVFNAISVGIDYAKKCGIHKIYFLSRPSLARVIRKMGIICPQIGDKTQFRGVRFPYQFDLANFPLHLFETQSALQDFHRKKTYSHYCQASVLDDWQKLRAAA